MKMCVAIRKAARKLRQVLDCGSPLPLFHRLRAFESGRRLPQSKTLARTLTAALVLTLHFVASAAILDKDRALGAQTFWDNRDFDWFKRNIPFFDCPDADMVTTYYYRWELVTKHLIYGSPNSGYSFTEFIDRPFWSGAYGAISCPAGHQLYEVRWLNDSRYARDYSRYWFRAEGAQPRRYGCWIADGVWAAHEVHPDDVFVRDLLGDLKNNYAEWEKRQFVPEVGLFWQNGHDDGMEYNITSRQTQDIVRGANGYRPSFNSYMWADALAIARVARLAGDEATAMTYEAKAASLKEKLQKLLWDPKREFFFPMFMRDERDKEGNIVKALTLTYQSGKFAGNEHGREEIGFVPWQFNLPDAGHERAWKFLMDHDYFFADFGPSTVERNDPQFLLQKTCCWWSGQSWPYATAQTLKALANLLQNYKQSVITRDDYVKLLHIYAASHRKNGQPYLAEACHPDTGSWEGHDSYNHSEHYFHSSFNDLIITGLIGLKPRADDVVEIDPLAPHEWDYFALEDVPYRGRKLTVVWDRDGKHYGLGAGLRVLADGKELAMLNAVGRISVRLPATDTAAALRSSRAPMNFAVNNDGEFYPRATASFSNPKTPVSKVNDGNYWYTVHPPNRWTSAGSGETNAWVAIDLGTNRVIDTVKLYLLDDGTNVVAPASFKLQMSDGHDWFDVPNQARTPAVPTGHRANVITFPQIATRDIRAWFTHNQDVSAGLSEFEVWGPAESPYRPPPPRARSLAFSRNAEGFPKATASFSDRYGGAPKFAIDGRINFNPTPMNRWTSYGSTNASDWLEIDFGSPTQVGRAELHIYDDGGGVQAPASYAVQYFAEGSWREPLTQLKSPASPAGGAMNTVSFEKVTTSKLRFVFTHKGRARSGVTEIEVWRD
jgi:hypothetical protein